MGELMGVRCIASHYLQVHRIDRLSVKSLETIERIRRVTTDNLNVFMGIAFNQYNLVTIVWKYEARCTLYVSARSCRRSCRRTW